MQSFFRQRLKISSANANANANAIIGQSMRAAWILKEFENSVSSNAGGYV